MVEAFEKRTKKKNEKRILSIKMVRIVTGIGIYS
jgi:hypothetical protein